MAGTATISTIKHDVTGAATTFRDGAGNEIGRFCRAFICLNGATPALNASFNISSLTRNSTGNFSFNFTNAFTDGYYGVGYLGCDSSAYISGFNDSNTLPSTTSVRFLTLTGAISLSNTNLTTWVFTR
ncbi:hypothetical protein EB001_21455 [bacterium]|nr:hypothetical protein [bacterium]